MSTTTASDTLATRLLAALLAADRRAAESVIDDALFEGMSGVDVLDDLIAPTMREVGRLWESSQITIADEHLATAIAHATLTRVYPHLVTASPRSRGTVLLAGADGEEHVLGLRMVADALEGAGFDVRNVGASLPPDPLASAVVRHRPVLVGLANTMGGAGALRRSVDAVRSVAPGLPILLGGAAAADVAPTDARTEICTSARAALGAADRMISVSRSPADAA